MKKRLFALCAALFAAGSVMAGVNPAYNFVKGKGYDDVEALCLPHALRTEGVRDVIFGEGLPAGEHTVCARVELPRYVRGLFFATDTLPNRWPNNTNRLLPWTFNRLEELARSDYAGIPSAWGPSMLGDALLLELAEGGCLLLKALAGENSLSWLRVCDDGSLKVYVSTLGPDALDGRVPLLVCWHADSVYEAFEGACGRLARRGSEVSHLRRRGEKPYYEPFCYLGWCTWEHYHDDIDEERILGDIATIKASGIPVRYVLIDDGHLAHSGRRLASFTPDARRFPHGWSRIMAQKSDRGIRWMGLWYALSGYWEGLSADNDFPEPVRRTLVEHNGRTVPGGSDEAIGSFYRYFVRSLREAGFDFLKIDNQSFTLPIYMGSERAVAQAVSCNRAMDRETAAQGMGLINCMAQNVINIDNTYHSCASRVSIDYEKYNLTKGKSHLYQAYTTTLLQGESVWPDHDMYHSSDSVSAAVMARSKALSGGPVYLSDSPREFVPANIWPLIDAEGRLFRPQTPARPTPESVFVNALTDGRPYRVYARLRRGAVALCCYNLNVGAQHRTVTASVTPEDYARLSGRRGRAVLYDWKRGVAEELTAPTQVRIEGFDDALFHLCPIEMGWAVIGIAGKYLSPQTVEVVSISPRRLKLRVLTPGTLKVWADDGAGGSLRSIEVGRAGEVVVER